MYSVNSIFYYISTCFFAVYYITSKLLFFYKKVKKRRQVYALVCMLLEKTNEFLFQTYSKLIFQTIKVIFFFKNIWNL